MNRIPDKSMQPSRSPTASGQAQPISVFDPPPLAPRRPAGGGETIRAPATTETVSTVRPAVPPRAAGEARRITIRVEPDEPSLLHHWLRIAPAWLISCLFHMAAIIVLGLIPLLGSRTESMDLVMATADNDGEQLDLEAFESEDLLQEFDEQADSTAADALPIVEDPAAASAPEVELTTEGMSVSPLAAPAASTALEGREPGMQRVLLNMFGGTEGTERAVLQGLGWLVQVQQRDPGTRSTYGTWSLRGPYGDPAPVENREAATALALLAFQGHGVTHRRGPEEFRQAVERGQAALVRMQSRDGSLMSRKHPTAHNHRIYTHCLATIALCELYGMSQDEELREPAQRAVDFLVSIQSKQGGWRYEPGYDADLSVTGWAVMALKSARMAGLEVSDAAFDQVEQYLDSVARDGGSAFIYGEETNEQPTVSMTAVGLLCRQYLGTPRDDPALVAGAKRLLNNPIDYEQKDVYEWYYSTQVLHQMGGPMWDEWNARMVETLPAEQQQRGRDAGSWSPVDDEWGRYGGRLFQTCLSIYMLEVYYRHMPLYKVVE
ncbi:MAG: prenyltransferase/squalene oxidase repeat-containing protein [Pirellulales bacterium]